MRATPLGGCGEFGLHSTLVQAKGTSLCVDTGLLFPNDEHPGVDFLVPDFQALGTARPAAYLLTHGHEDHVGALAFALRTAPAPVYASAMTLALARPRLDELGSLRGADLREIGPDAEIDLGELRAKALPVRHSVPGALAYLVEGDGRRLLFTGDHRGLGCPPPEGVDVAFADSTGALRDTPSPTETEVAHALGEVLSAVPIDRRIIVALFASNLERVQTLFDLAARLGRRAAVIGRSLVETAGAGRDLGLLRSAPGVWVDPARANLLLVTGTQGEARGALSRLATGQSSDVTLAWGDIVILSGRPILGNERAVSRVFDALAARGAQVIDDPSLHASGHAGRDELSTLLRGLRPGGLVPIHGAPRHLWAHAKLAQEAGVPNALVIDNGETILVEEGGGRVIATLPTGRRCVESGAIVAPAVVEQRLEARGGVVSIAEGRARLAGIAGLSQSEIERVFEAGGEEAVKRLVRKRTGKRPLVIVHTSDKTD